MTVSLLIINPNTGIQKPALVFRPDLEDHDTGRDDLNPSWYQAAIVERWRGGLKLVPEGWPQNS